MGKMWILKARKIRLPHYALRLFPLKAIKRGSIRERLQWAARQRSLALAQEVTFPTLNHAPVVSSLRLDFPGMYKSTVELAAAARVLLRSTAMAKVMF
jgi:hypothetical protein